MSSPSTFGRSAPDGTDQTANDYYPSDLPVDDSAGRWNLNLLEFQASVLTSLLLLTIGCGRLSTAPQPESSSAAQAAAVAEIRVHPEEFEVEVGEGLDLDSEVLAEDGSPVDRSVTWRSRDTSIAMVSDDGHLVARTEGEVEVVASADGVEDEARGAIVPHRVARLLVSADSLTLAVGEEKTLDGTAVGQIGRAHV